MKENDFYIQSFNPESLALAQESGKYYFINKSGAYYLENDEPHYIDCDEKVLKKSPFRAMEKLPIDGLYCAITKDDETGHVLAVQQMEEGKTKAISIATNYDKPSIETLVERIPGKDCLKYVVGAVARDPNLLTFVPDNVFVDLLIHDNVDMLLDDIGLQIIDNAKRNGQVYDMKHLSMLISEKYGSIMDKLASLDIVVDPKDSDYSLNNLLKTLNSINYHEQE